MTFYQFLKDDLVGRVCFVALVVMILLHFGIIFLRAYIIGNDPIARYAVDGHEYFRYRGSSQAPLTHSESCPCKK